ncbi:MAG: transglycosylase SLT domain-containing protein [Patescibacteria group bacterium]|nr:transglycosylase SLT domain-containing protein [Patescibacteria group bacterium]
MKTFLLACNVLLPISLVGVVLLFIFGPAIEKKLTPERRAVLARGVENVMSSRVEASVPKYDPMKMPPKDDLIKMTGEEQSFKKDSLFKVCLLAATPLLQPLIFQSPPPKAAEKVAVTKKAGVKKGKARGIKLCTPKRNSEIEAQIQVAIEAGIARSPYIIQHYGKIVEDTCPKKGIDPDLEYAKIAVESQGYNDSTVVSDSGALFLEQLMPKTAMHLLSLRGIIVTDMAVLRKMLLDPRLSISLGTDHYLISMQLFNDPVKALIAYEAGDDRVLRQIRKYGGDVEVPYYRKVYGVYAWIKQHPELRQNRGMPFDPAMRAPSDPVQIAVIGQ